MLAMLRGSFSAEILKQYKRAATWVLLATGLILTLVFGYALPYTSYATSDQPQRPPAQEALASTLPGQLVPNSIGGFALFVGGIAVVFGALAMGSEYGWDTLKTTLTQRPTRLTVLGGKLLALSAMLLGAVLIYFAVNAAVSAAIATAEGQPVAFPAAQELIEGVLSGWLILTMWTTAGAVLALAFRSVALPIGLGVVWILGVENLIANAANTLLTALQPVRDVLPSTNAGSLIYSLAPAVGDGVPGVSDAVSGTRAVATLAVYLVVLATAGALTLRRRDVT